MLLPDKHITLAESTLGLGAFVLGQLDSPRSIDQLCLSVTSGYRQAHLQVVHDFDSVVLAVLFLYCIGAVEATEAGAIRKCAS